MELKVLFYNVLILTTKSLNCTFMELKDNNEQLKQAQIASLNCTFMELKVELGRVNKQIAIVLIVPLWN